MSDFRVIIDNANGFIGKQLSRELQREKINFEYESEETRNLERNDVLILNSWGTVPKSSALHPEIELERSLIPLILKISKLGARKPGHIIFVSSAGAIYSGEPDLIDEITSLAPTSYYGAGKASAEMFLRVAALQFKIPLTIVRPSNVFGPGQIYRKGFGIVPTIFHAIHNGEAMELWPSSMEKKDYIYVTDFIGAMLKIIRAAPPAIECPAVFNISSGFHANAFDLISLSESISGRPCLILKNVSASSAVCMNALPNNARFSQQFSWFASVNLREGITRTFMWLNAKKLNL